MAINMPGQKKDQLTAIAQALGIIGQVTNVKLARGQLAEYEASQKGELTPLKKQQLGMSGYKVISSEDVSALDPISKQRVIPFMEGGQQVFAYKAPTAQELNQINLQNLQRDKLTAETTKITKEVKGELLPKEEREVTQKLITKREALDKEFRPLERLYGSIDQLEQKYKSGKFNPQDSVQLIRLIVPLSEVTPGVVREQEVVMTSDQQSSLDKAQGFTIKKLTGQSLTDKVISDMFDTVKTLKPVVSQLKAKGISNIAEESKLFKVDKNIDVILGEKNKLLIQDPQMFAQFGKPKKPVTAEQAVSSNQASDYALKLLEEMKGTAQNNNTMVPFRPPGS